LRSLEQAHQGLKLVQIVDAAGRLVATSRRGGRLLNGDTPWFRGLVDAGTESPQVGDIYRPPGASLPLLDLAYPIYHDDGRFLGATRALVDAAHLYSVLAPVRIGRTGHATLLRATNGLILASSESHEILTQAFAGFAQLEYAMRPHAAPEGLLSVFAPRQVRPAVERRGYCKIPEIRQKAAGGEAVLQPARLVGFSPVERVPNVQWLVVVEQDLSEAEAPVQAVTRYLWIHFIGAFGSVILLALYLSFKLETPVIEDALHLHEQHVPKGMQAED
jgi:hypothetical protein